jgi:hypothetical protein
MVLSDRTRAEILPQRFPRGHYSAGNRQRSFSPERISWASIRMSRSGGADARVLLRKYSFLGSHHTLVEARGVKVGQIRRFLVWLIEHFSSAAGIFLIFLDQLRD